MRVLLDTHAVLWWVDQDQFLSTAAHAIIADPTNELVLSAATIWELAIKVGLKKLSLSLPYGQWLTQAIADLDASILPITIAYADRQLRLPPHHGDPFDRLLIAQALVENIPLLSIDAIFDRYDVARLW